MFLKLQIQGFKGLLVAKWCRSSRPKIDTTTIHDLPNETLEMIFGHVHQAPRKLKYPCYKPEDLYSIALTYRKWFRPACEVHAWKFAREVERDRRYVVYLKELNLHHVASLWLSRAKVELRWSMNKKSRISWQKKLWSKIRQRTSW